MSKEQWRVPFEQLRNSCDPDSLGFETTDSVPPIEGMVGQDRAVRAVEFGLKIVNDGFNLYASGPTGTGRMTTLKKYLSQLAPSQPTPDDWCYVHNFGEDYYPEAMCLPAGKGQELAKAMDRFLEGAKEELPRAFQSEHYAKRREEVLADVEKRREEVTNRLEQDARKEGFTIQAMPGGIMTVPLIENRPMTNEEFQGLPEDEQKTLKEKGERLKEELEQAMRVARNLEQEARERVDHLDREIALLSVSPLLEGIRNDFHDFPQVLDYVNKLQNDVPDHIGDFQPREDAQGGAKQEPIEGLLREDHLLRYKVNVFVDNSAKQGAPIIVEYRPTYYNLFGRIDFRSRFGMLTTDFTMVKPGAIHLANGGYLVIQAQDVLTSPLSWETLKRTLRSKEGRIENLGEQYSPMPTTSLRPQSIPIDIKVVMVGSPMLYNLLYSLDEDFRRLFRVKADFDVEMDRTPDHVEQYAGFISSYSRAHKLKSFHKSAVAKIIDYGSRSIEHQSRLSTRFLDISSLVTESNYWSLQSGNECVMAVDVKRAIVEREYRSSLAEDKLHRYIMEDTIHITTTGSATAQVNALSVMSTGDYMFGRPNRITAITAFGSKGFTNIEREIEMSGAIHSKGFLILSNYLSGKYAQDKPLALSASLTFEQMYDEIDGDSASSTELYALLSSLSGLPINQSIAVTGSVNQMGQVQAIGGAIYKIEGFYQVCKDRGLTGEQGVMIPADNVKNLMLKDEVMEAIKEGKFHIWAVKSIDEGIEILTGVPAGQRSEDGTYPKGMVNYLVDQKLRDYAGRLKEFGLLPASAEKSRLLAAHADGRQNEEDKEIPKEPGTDQKIVDN